MTKSDRYFSIFWRVFLAAVIIVNLGYISGALGVWAVAAGFWVSVGKGVIVGFLQYGIVAFTTWRINERLAR